MTNPRAVSVQEALDRLGGISRRTFGRWEQRGLIRTVCVGGRRFVPVAELAGLLSTHKSGRRSGRTTASKGEGDEPANPKQSL